MSSAVQYFESHLYCPNCYESKVFGSYEQKNCERIYVYHCDACGFRSFDDEDFLIDTKGM